MTTSVAYAMSCAERDAWSEAAAAYRTSRGAAHIEARAVFWPMVRVELMRLRGQRAELAAAVMRSNQRRLAA